MNQSPASRAFVRVAFVLRFPESIARDNCNRYTYSALELFVIDLRLAIARASSDTVIMSEMTAHADPGVTGATSAVKKRKTTKRSQAAAGKEAQRLAAEKLAARAEADQRQASDSFGTLPFETLIEILSYLDPLSLLKMSMTSRRFHDILQTDKRYATDALLLQPF